MNHEQATKTLTTINAWLSGKGGPKVELFPHTHLDLPEGHYSTFIEGWYLDDLYGMQAVSEAIHNGEITLPANVFHEMFSHCEMYFYSNI